MGYANFFIFFGILFEMSVRKRIAMSEYMKDLGDLTLLKESSRGNPKALMELMRRHIEIVALTSYRILCDHDESVRVVRKVFMGLWKKSLDYDYSVDIRNWLLVRTVAQSKKRLWKIRLAAVFGVHPSLFAQSAPVVEDVDDYITTQAWEVFCRASLGMRPLQRVVYAVRELDSLPVNVSELVTGLGSRRLRHLLGQARKRMKAELARFGKVAEYAPYVTFLKNVRDRLIDYDGLEEEILYLCTKMH